MSNYGLLFNVDVICYPYHNLYGGFVQFSWIRFPWSSLWYGGGCFVSAMFMLGNGPKLNLDMEVVWLTKFCDDLTLESILKLYKYSHFCSLCVVLFSVTLEFAARSTSRADWIIHAQIRPSTLSQNCFVFMLHLGRCCAKSSILQSCTWKLIILVCEQQWRIEHLTASIKSVRFVNRQNDVSWVFSTLTDKVNAVHS